MTSTVGAGGHSEFPVRRRGRPVGRGRPDRWALPGPVETAAALLIGRGGRRGAGRTPIPSRPHSRSRAGSRVRAARSGGAAWRWRSGARDVVFWIAATPIRVWRWTEMECRLRLSH